MFPGLQGQSRRQRHGDQQILNRPGLLHLGPHTLIADPLMGRVRVHQGQAVRRVEDKVARRGLPHIDRLAGKRGLPRRVLELRRLNTRKEKRGPLSVHLSARTGRWVSVKRRLPVLTHGGSPHGVLYAWSGILCSLTRGYPFAGSLLETPSAQHGGGTGAGLLRRLSLLFERHEPWTSQLSGRLPHRLKDLAGIAEADLRLGRVDVDVHQRGVQGQEQGPVSGQLPRRCTHGALDEGIVHGPAVDEGHDVVPRRHALDARLAGLMPALKGKVARFGFRFLYLRARAP